MKQFLRDNGLTLFFLLLFLGALVGQAFVGLADYNNQQIAEGGHTVWLVQRGSPESKKIHKRGTESDADQKVGEYAEPTSPAWAAASGLRRTLFSRSLGLVMGTIFVLSWLVQSITGRVSYNSHQLAQYEDTLSWAQYVGSADFWSRTLQNWQSEFLAVASMAALSIYLRQRGSPESKPVGAAHGATDVEG